jgi:[protein-PII] uridylyltransferase
MSDNSVLLSDFYAREFARIRQGFASTGDGCAAALERAAAVDALVGRLYPSNVAPGLSSPESFCLVALGGYGRRELFPHSDIDLLFLSEDTRTLVRMKERVAVLARTLWDAGLRVSNTSRELAECGELHQDNLEFSIALLDCRYLAGDARLFAKLRDRVLPHLVARDRRDLIRRLGDATEDRRSKHGNTIFHLEPNLKEAPGGLRDYHVARWLAVIFQLEETAQWAVPEKHWPPALAAEAAGAFDFLASTRAFVHYRMDRDDNLLTYELQDEAAAAGIGSSSRAPLPPEDWMRRYFRHARSIDRLVTALFDEAAPPRASLYGLFQDWRSRLSTPEFSVVRGRILPRQPGETFQDPVVLLGLFEFAARHGLELSREAERRVTEALPHVNEIVLRASSLWQAFRLILLAPHAARALRAMHRLGVLDRLFPEFRAIDSLVVRDFYHRYTVDEHSLLTVENLDRLRPAKRAGKALESWNQKFSEIFQELEQSELLYLALLFHDVGKGLAPGDHVRGSLEAVERVFDRLALPAEDRETVRFLIRDHLMMSATLLRRDIFDAETVRSFAEKVGTPERLKMLCLLTYADVKSVNPEALTPWKAEMLWQLYASTANDLARSLDEERVHSGAEEEAAVARVMEKLEGGQSRAPLAAFLEGFPRRYLLSHSPEEIASHFRMAEQVAQAESSDRGGKAIQVALSARPHSFELTVVTRDRPFLFASLTGTLAAWGMNILKADAFSNAAGIVLDTFRFADLFRTLELNPPERERFERCVVDVLSGKADLAELLRGRARPESLSRPKVEVPAQVRFEQDKGARTTLLEVVTYDRPGLLYQVSSTLAGLGLNIEIALIDTEGQKVIDVFYLTAQGAPLDDGLQAKTRDALLEKLR